MTEDEARRKLCHRTLGRTGGPMNCWGSDCVAWVETAPETDEYERKYGLRKPKGQLNPPFSNCPEGFEVTGHDSHGYYQVRKKVGVIPAQGNCGLKSVL